MNWDALGEECLAGLRKEPKICRRSCLSTSGILSRILKSKSSLFVMNMESSEGDNTTVCSTVACR